MFGHVLVELPRFRGSRSPPLLQKASQRGVGGGGVAGFGSQDVMSMISGLNTPEKMAETAAERHTFLRPASGPRESDADLRPLCPTTRVPPSPFPISPPDGMRRFPFSRLFIHENDFSMFNS